MVSGDVALSTRDLDHQMTEFIHLHLVARINEYRRAHFFDHRRTFETIAAPRRSLKDEATLLHTGEASS